MESAKVRQAIVAAACAMALAVPAGAQSVQHRDQEQQQRIDNGIATGKLTPGEAARDQRHLTQDELARQRDRAMHGGHLTQAERAHLNQRLNHNSARIYDTKHNNAGAPY